MARDARNRRHHVSTERQRAKRMNTAVRAEPHLISSATGTPSALASRRSTASEGSLRPFSIIVMYGRVTFAFGKLGLRHVLSLSKPPDHWSSSSTSQVTYGYSRRQAQTMRRALDRSAASGPDA